MAITANKSKKSAADVIFTTVILTILIIYTVSIFIVLIWGFITSFKTNADFNGNVLGLPSDPRYWEGLTNTVKKINYERYLDALKFGNYIEIFEKLKYTQEVSYYPLFATKAVQIKAIDVTFFGMLGNTLYMAGLASLIQVLICYSTAYMCAKYKFKFSSFIYSLVIIMMTIPTIGTTPAMIDLLQKLNLYGRHIGILIMRAGFSGMYFLVFHAFFEGLPDSYTEAAEIDGANQMDIFLRIIIPLGINMIGTVTLLLFVGNWNDYNMSFVYMPTVPTLAFGIYAFAHLNNRFNGVEKHPALQMAGCFLTVTPILILFIFLKDKLMGNISAGGLKG